MIKQGEASENEYRLIDQLSPGFQHKRNIKKSQQMAVRHTI